MFEFKLPDLGEGIHEGQIVNVLVKEGDQVKEFAPMLEVETDKAAVEIPSPKTGKVTKINVKAGQQVKVGEVMLVIDTGAAASTPAAQTPQAPAKPAPAPSPAKAAAPPPAPARTPEPARVPAPAPAAAPMRPAAVATATAPAARRDGPIPAAPVVRKLAREMGVDLGMVPGSGPSGRVLKEDVERYSLGHRGAAPAAPAEQAAADGDAGGSLAIPTEPLPDFSQYGPIRREPVSQIRKTIARQMTRAWLNVTRVTHGDEVDITDVERNRKRYNDKLKEGQAKLSVTAIVMKAVAVCLQEHPKFNCSFDHARNEIIYKDFVHLGVAVDGPRGLIVPVVRDCHLKTLPQIAADLNMLAQKVRDNKIEIAELRGATFTVSNVGALGGTFATPMVNYPEVAILGMAKAVQKPTVFNGEIVPRLILPIFMSYDHRVIDGADGARFCSELRDMLENPLRLLGA